MDRIRRFFYGRYGLDNLTIALLLFSVLLINIKYIWLAGLVSTGYAVFRILSKNTGKRKKELEKFNTAANKLRKFLMPAAMTAARGLITAGKKAGNYKMRLAQRKQFVFVKCPKCRKMLRLPRNKGKLSVTCPICRAEFLKKT